MKTLLIFAYEFDSESQVFSHKVEIVKRLLPSFEKIIVITPKVGLKESNDELSPGLEVVKLNFHGNSKLLKSLQLVVTTKKVLEANSVDVVFYFMTEVFAAILGLFFRTLRVKQVLWYAHAHRSLGLSLAFPLMNSVCSSTEGSIPIKGSKVCLIGQMVDQSLFPFDTDIVHQQFSLIHIGRFDPSKNILEIIENVLSAQRIFPKLKVCIVGSPTGRMGEDYLKFIRKKFCVEIDLGIVVLRPSVRRSELSHLLRENKVFIHAFQGSLDKTLIEATLSGLAVVTTNNEYLNEFGAWSREGKTLKDQLFAILTAPDDFLSRELYRRYRVAADNHSLEQWLSKITPILQN